MEREAAGEAENRVRHLRRAILETPRAEAEHIERLESVRLDLEALLVPLRGDETLSARERPQAPSISDRIDSAVSGRKNVTSPPTGTHRDQYRYALEAFGPVLEQLRSVIDRLETLEAELDELGAPWTPGRVPGGRNTPES
ncbi:MAG: hypothetical protein ACO396_10055 [Phycisphaerales bacterium]